MKGLDYDALFPGRFLKAGEFKGQDVTLTIAAIRTEDLPQDQGGNKTKGIITFRETKKELVLNRTNGESFKAMWGRDTGEWIGKHVTLFPDQFNGELAIRVRGSPDLAKPITFELKLPKRKAQEKTLIVTGKKPNGRATPPAPAGPPSSAAQSQPGDDPPPDFSQVGDGGQMPLEPGSDG